MNDTAHFLSATIPLPKPRKLPKQGRSRILVESLKQACLLILQRDGYKALTATRIASVSGVAMGSLYQYFPNVDAIVVATYEDLLRAQAESSAPAKACAKADFCLEQLSLDQMPDCPGWSELTNYLQKLTPVASSANTTTAG